MSDELAAGNADATSVLAALFDSIRVEHKIDVMQSNLLACTCGELLPIVYGEDGSPLYNPALRHHHEKQAEATWGFLAERGASAQTSKGQADWFESGDGHGYVYLGPIHYLCECGDYFLNRDRWMFHKGVESTRPTPPGEPMPERACPACGHRWEDSMIDCPMCGTEACIAPPGNLCTETGCWDADRCVVARVIPPATTKDGGLPARTTDGTGMSEHMTESVYTGSRSKPNPDQPDRCPSIDPHDTLQCGRRSHDDDQCQYGGIGWRKGTRPRHEPPAILYHWSPSRNRVSIVREGLRPGSPSNTFPEWSPPHICYGETPAGALGLTLLDDELDLWMVRTGGHAFTLANDGAEWRSSGTNPAWYVATRAPRDPVIDMTAAEQAEADEIVASLWEDAAANGGDEASQ